MLIVNYHVIIFIKDIIVTAWYYYTDIIWYMSYHPNLIFLSIQLSVQKNSHIDDLTINAAAQGTQVAILMPDKITSRVNLIKSPRLTTHKIMQIF